MDCTQSLVELFCHSFPEIDRRVIKATVLEYGNDIESAINDLIDISDQIKGTSFIDHLKVQCCSLLCPAEDVAEQASIKEKKSEVVGVSPSTNCNQSVSPSENMAPDASDLQTDVHSAGFVEHCGSDNNIIAEPLTIKGFKSERLDNSIDIVNVASTLECTVQEARSDIDDVINLVKEVSDLRVKTDQERIAAKNAKVEAARGGEDLLMKACEVNKQTQKMKQDNLKLSWEIHGEKSVLAFEAEELNVHLQQMKQQKEKAVTALHEIRDTLQSCYDTAVEDRKMAEEDRQLKEEKAGKVLEQEEDLRAMTEQETKTLKMEAETCTLMRDFLVDHGSIVDALQGEIKKLFEEVKYLKEQVQGMRSSTNVASDQELAQHSESLYSLRSNSTSSGEMTNSLASQYSASTSRLDLNQQLQDMTNSLASQYSASTSRLDLNQQPKSQFLYSSGIREFRVSESFDGTTKDGPITYMNNGGKLRSKMSMQGPSFIEDSYDLQVPGLFPYRHVVTHQHPAFSEHGEVIVDSNRFGSSHHQHAFSAHGDDFNGYGYPQGVTDRDRALDEEVNLDSNRYGYPNVAMTDWSSKIDNGWRNLDWVLASKQQGSNSRGFLTEDKLSLGLSD